VVVVLAALAAAPIPASAQAPAATAAPTLEARLERLAAELERNRIDQHAPGAAVAVVRGGELIFVRGFGLANVAEKTPVTPETRFFIGSTTKAFTATLVGMLVDEGVMRWDDPADRHLPYFTLALDSDDPAARATLRDLLSHRTGFPRISLLLANGVLSPEEILRQASQAEPFSRFRQRFHYNNEQYLAAGWAAAAAAGRPWDELTRSRILDPLGMTSTETSARRARAALAVLFAGVGLYGVVAYSVSARTTELGVRMALGSSRARILALVLWQGAAMAAIGAALGLLLAFGAMRGLASLLFEVSPLDPPTHAAANQFVMAIALLAAFVPAWRASRLSPMTALRYEE
jgi:CubicO group peptidase (beta-lactamase class C family)